MVINKSGSDLGSITEVEIEVSDDVLANYNAQNGTGYVKLPDNCYQIAEDRVEFGADNL